MKRVYLFVIPLILVGSFVACSQIGSQSPSASNAFAYAGAAGGDTGAFMVITNPTAAEDKLVSASSTISDRTELHTVVKDDKGAMVMQPVENILVPASGTVELKPGSFHVMFFGLKKEMKTGESFPITLKYEKGGEATVQILVKDRN